MKIQEELLQFGKKLCPDGLPNPYSDLVAMAIVTIDTLEVDALVDAGKLFASQSRIDELEADLQAERLKAHESLSALQSRVSELEKVLRFIAEPGCGCWPICRCTEPEALKLFRDVVMEEARSVLPASDARVQR